MNVVLVLRVTKTPAKNYSSLGDQSMFKTVFIRSVEILLDWKLSIIAVIPAATKCSKSARDL